MRCSKCNRQLAKDAKFCHHCGAELTSEELDKNVSWYYEPVFVLLMIFLFLAIFGLPLLWKSPHFARWQKVTISILTTIYTGLILWAFYYLVFVVFLGYYRQLMSVM